MGIREVIGGIMLLVIYMICQNQSSQERIKTSINTCKNKREVPEGVVVNGYRTLSRLFSAIFSIFNTIQYPY